MLFSIARLAGRVAAVTVIGTGLAAAQDCPRGDLDKAYCDRNGDLAWQLAMRIASLVEAPDGV